MIDFSKIYTEAFWARPPIDRTAMGDPIPTAIFAATGSALSAFEMLEEQFMRLFLCFCHTSDVHTARAIEQSFGVVESGATRAKMISVVAPLYFGAYFEMPEVRNPLKNLLKAHGWAAHRRDEFAHGIVSSHQKNIGDGSGLQTMQPLGSFLSAAEYNQSRNELWHNFSLEEDVIFSRSKYRYTSIQIAEFSRKFNELMHETIKYIVSIQKKDGWPKNVIDILASRANHTSSDLSQKQ